MSPYMHALYITHYITLEVLSVTIPLVLSKTLFKSLVLKQNFSRNPRICLFKRTTFKVKRFAFSFMHLADTFKTNYFLNYNITRF